LFGLGFLDNLCLDPTTNHKQFAHSLQMVAMQATKNRTKLATNWLCVASEADNWLILIHGPY